MPLVHDIAGFAVRRTLDSFNAAVTKRLPSDADPLGAEAQQAGRPTTANNPNVRSPVDDYFGTKKKAPDGVRKAASASALAIPKWVWYAAGAVGLFFVFGGMKFFKGR